MTTVEQIQAYFGLDPAQPSPVEIRNVTRAALGPLCAHLGFTTGAEIGVWRGEFSELLCRTNPALRLLCVDAWTPYPDYRSYRRPQKFQVAEADAHARLAPYHCTFIRNFSLEAAKGVPDRSLDVVYIDANHNFDAVMQDIIVWSQKVRPGGIVSGHDYFTENRSLGFRVVEAVQAYVVAHDITPWFLFGRRKRRRGELGERERSWMWVQP